MDGLELTMEVMDRFPTPILIISASVQKEDTQQVFQLLNAAHTHALSLSLSPARPRFKHHGGEGGLLGFSGGFFGGLFWGWRGKLGLVSLYWAVFGLSIDFWGLSRAFLGLFR